MDFDLAFAKWSKSGFHYCKVTRKKFFKAILRNDMFLPEDGLNPGNRSHTCVLSRSRRQLAELSITSEKSAKRSFQKLKIYLPVSLKLLFMHSNETC